MKGVVAMAQYLISFDDGWMDFPEEDFQAVSDAAHAVQAQAKDAGAWIFGAGLHTQRATVVEVDQSVSEGPFPETKAVLGGFCIIEAADRDEATMWAQRFAVACRTRQEVRELMFDPQA
jgi:hypothetical protein